jgi:hypothetical protein
MDIENDAEEKCEEYGLSIIWNKEQGNEEVEVLICDDDGEN